MTRLTDAQVAPAEPAEGEAVGLIAGTGLTLLKEGYAATVWPVSTGDIQDDTVHRLYTGSPDREAATREAVTLQPLRDLLIDMGRTVADPMWSDHVELSKGTLRRWIATVRAALAQQAKPQQAGATREQLQEIRDALVSPANGGAIVDVMWMPAEPFPIETVIDRIDHLLGVRS